MSPFSPPAGFVVPDVILGLIVTFAALVILP